MDDLTFCLSDCQRTYCFRHPSNIQDRTIPHSYADFRETDTCPSRQLIEKMQLSKEDATKDATFDCIDRQAAIDALNEYFARIGKLKRRGLNKGEKAISLDTVETIKTLPSVQPQRWIPVTERLPEHSGFYIVTAIVTDDGGKLVGLRWFSQEHGWKFGKNPLAWMPLPEPWRGEGHETN